MGSDTAENATDISTTIDGRLFLMAVASEYVVGKLNGLPANASSHFILDLFIDVKLRHKSNKISLALRPCKFSIFVAKHNLCKEG